MAFEPLGIQAIAQGVPEFGRALDSMERSISKVGKAAEGLGGTFLAAGDLATKAVFGLASAVIGGLGAAGGAILGLAISTAPLEGIKGAFDDLTASAKLVGDEVLKSMKTASDGMLSNRDIMLLWNEAALKVGTAFAKDLPNQLEYLTKAALATDQDLNKVVERYIKGVDSMSSSALAEIGVQVNRTKAYENFAKIVGKEVKDLTEAQKQRAFTIAANAALAKTYKDTADKADLNTVRLRRLKATFTDVRDEIGLSLQPAFGHLLDTIDHLVELVLPKLTAFFREKVIPNVDNIVKQIGLFYERLKDGYNIFEVFGQGLADTLGFSEGTRRKMWDFIQQVGDAWFKLKDFVVQNKDIIIGAIKTIGKVLLAAAFAKTITRILGGLTNPINLLIGGVGLLSVAWQANFLGIRDILTRFWEGKGKGIFADLITFAKEKIPAALETLVAFFTDRVAPKLAELWTNLKPVLSKVWEFIVTKVLPAIGTLADWLATNLPPAIDAVVTWVTTKLIPALGDVWRWLQEKVPAAFNTVKTFILEKFIPAVTGIWEAIKPTFDSIISFLETYVLPVFQNLFGGGAEGGNPLQPFIDGILSLKAKLPQPIQDILDQWARFVTAFIENIGPMLAGLGFFVNYIAQTFGPTIGRIISAVASVIALLFQKGSVGLEKFGGLFASIGLVIGGALSLIVATIENALVIVATVVEVIANLLRGDLSGAFDAAIQGIVTFFNNAFALVGTNLEEVAGIWQKNIEMLATIISEVWDRIVGTVKTKITEFADAVSTGVQNLVSGVKDLLGIHSPSKVFQQIGQDIVNGLQAGMAMQPATAAVTNNSSVSTTNNFNLTVNSASPAEPVAQDFAMLQALARRR